MARNKLDELEMPAPEAPEQDEMLDVDADMDMSDEEMPEDEEAAPSLTDAKDEDLLDELEARGYDVSALAPSKEAPEAEEELDMEIEFDEE